METVRDLSEVDLWQESLQRSLARRGRLPRTSPELAQLRPARDLSDDEFMSEYAHYWRMRRDASTRRPLMPAVGVGGISTLALLAATLPSLLGGRGASARAERIAYVDHNLRPADPALAPARPAARSDVGHLILRPPSEPRATRSTMPVTTPPPPAAVPVVSQPQIVASAAPAASTTASHTSVQHSAVHPAHRTQLDARRVTPAHHASQPAVAATVARSPKTVRHASRSSGHPNGSGGAAPQSAPRHRHVSTSQHASTSQPASSSRPATASGGAAVRGSRRTTGTGSSGAYVDPLAHASVTPERIDQGVDYSASGRITALGPGKITYVGTSGTGWPGAFIEFRLSSGADAGRYVYYAEGVVPAQGLHVGERVRAGQTIATLTGGIEIGWGAGIGTESYAMEMGQWSSGMDSGNTATPAGRNFSALVASLGGPPGINEG